MCIRDRGRAAREGRCSPLSPYAMPGTDIGRRYLTNNVRCQGSTWDRPASHGTIRWSRVARPPSVLRHRYVMSGTEIAYAAYRRTA
eukprot:1108242-Rhodomonas_salina.1